MTRRARINPGQVGIHAGENRRVPGLRRGEAAALAGVSPEYYARLERGGLGTASDSVLDGLARALMMDDAEREHLHRLARQARASSSSRPSKRSERPWQPSSGIWWFLDSVGTSAALIGNGRTDLLAWNPLGGALMEEMINSSVSKTPNFARFLFFEPVARRFYPDWESAARMNVAQLRTEAGRDPNNKELHELVGELSTRNDYFRELWGQHNVWQHESGTKRMHHHAVGDLELHFDGLDVVGHPGHQVTVLTAEPGSPSYEALQILGSWAASPVLVGVTDKGENAAPEKP